MVRSQLDSTDGMVVQWSIPQFETTLLSSYDWLISLLHPVAASSLTRSQGLIAHLRYLRFAKNSATSSRASCSSRASSRGGTEADNVGQNEQDPQFLLQASSK